MRYGAFLSYSRDSDADLAIALQRGVEKFGKKWNQARSLKVFRDAASLSANPGLWSSIETALSESAWFVLLASPKAASSKWVDREIRWWLEHRSAQTMLIVLTGGDVAWDDESNDYDWVSSTAIPSALRGASHEMPRYVDARWSQSTDQLSEINPDLNEAIVDIASAVRGIEKDELVGDAVREHARTVRLARAVRMALASLFVAAVIAALIAISQRNSAIEQARIALSRQVAATAERELSTNLDVAMLLAVMAHRTQPNSETRSALIRANTASPKLVRYFPMGAQVNELAGSGDGNTAVAGLADGRVMRWTLAEPEPKELIRLPDAVSNLAISRDGGVVAASDGVHAMLWRRGHPIVPLRVPRGQEADIIAISPSGRTAVVHGAPETLGGAESISIVDVARATTKSVSDWRGLAAVSSMVAHSDAEVLLFDAGYGGWEQRRIPDWGLKSKAGVGFGTHQWGGEPSADGRFVTGTNAASTIPVWSTNWQGDARRPAFTARAPISSPNSLALSPNGRRLAVADSGAIYVAPVAATKASRPAAIELVGHGAINDDGVRFFGDGFHLLSSSGERVAMWDLGQIDRLAHPSRVPVPPGCSACPGARLAVSPDGKRLAIVGGFGDSALIQNLDDRAGIQALPGGFLDFTYLSPVWVNGGRRVVFPLQPASGDRNASPPTDLPETVRVWPAGDGREIVTAAQVATNGRAVIVVNSRGTIYRQDAETGEILQILPGPPELRLGDNYLRDAAIQSSAELVAMLSENDLTITALGDGRVVGDIPARTISHVTFSGSRLLLQRNDGSLEVWDMRGSDRERVLPGDRSYVWPPVGNSQGTLVARQRSNGSIVLADLDSGAVLSSFAQMPIKGLQKTGVTFSPDGRFLITVTDSYDKSGAYLIIRNISDEGLVRVACTSAGRDLSRAEWRRFVGPNPPEDLTCH
jgi:WD40 repeat protein